MRLSRLISINLLKANQKLMLKIENEIWEKIRDRDSSAFESLYDRFSGAMFSLSLEILGDRWEAEEVIQDIFSVLWKKPEAYSPQKRKVQQLAPCSHKESQYR